MAIPGYARSEHSVVRLRQSSFTGEMHTLCTLPTTPTPQMLIRLICGDQIAVTASGSQVALVLCRDKDEELFHTGFDARMSFQHPPIKEGGGTRILSVHEQEVLVWGRVRGYPPGVWFVAPGTRQYLFSMDRIKGSYANGTVHMPVGESEHFPHENVIITPWGLLPIAVGSKVELYADGTLCLVEELDGRSYAYEIGRERIEPFSSCTLDPTIRFVRWQGQHLIATRTPHRSLFIETGKRVGTKPRVIPIDGQLEEVWSSPTHEGLLTLVRPRETVGDERRLFFNHETLIQEGSFSLTRSDVFWSSGGFSFAARLHVTEQGVTSERLVTPTQERTFPACIKVKEALVDERGGVQAVIVSDGVWDKPIVRGRHLTAVPLAWNLHADPDGAIVWNTIHDDLVLKWVDRTHLEPRSVRYATTR